MRLLSVFHYVLGGITAVVSCIPVIHLAFGITILTGSFEPQDPLPPMVGWMFVAFAALIILGGWAFAVCLILAGKYLAAQEHYVFCLVVAGLACLFMPLGTALGVFTIIILMRDSVKGLFESPGVVDVPST